MPSNTTVRGHFRQSFNSETNNYPWISPWQHSPIVNGCTYTGYYKLHGEICIQEGNMISYITSLNRVVIRGITLTFKIAAGPRFRKGCD